MIIVVEVQKSNLAHGYLLCFTPQKKKCIRWGAAGPPERPWYTM